MKYSLASERIRIVILSCTRQQCLSKKGEEASAVVSILLPEARTWFMSVPASSLLKFSLQENSSPCPFPEKFENVDKGSIRLQSGSPIVITSMATNGFRDDDNQ